MQRKPLTNEHGEVRELTGDDLRNFRNADSALPASLKKKIGVRGPQKSPTKVQTSIRLSANVVETFRASGDGWQTRIDVVLSEWLKEHSPDEVSV